MGPTTAYVLLGVNVALLIGFFVQAARWGRKWLQEKVSAPVNELLNQLDQRMSIVEADAKRANDRLDRHLEAHSHG